MSNLAPPPLSGAGAWAPPEDLNLLPVQSDTAQDQDGGISITPSLPTPSLPNPSLPDPNQDPGEDAASSTSTGPAISPSLPTPSLPSADDGSSPLQSITPSMPSFTPGQSDDSTPAITPSLPGSGTVTPSLGGAQGTGQGNVVGQGGLSISIDNPDQLPSLPPGTRELKLVIGREAQPQAEKETIGFFDIFSAVFLAIVLAFLIGPWLQKKSQGFGAHLNAITFVQKNGVAVSIYLLAFTFGWIIFMIVLPQILMFDFSLRFNLPPSEIGGPRDVWTLKNYEYLLFGRPGDEEFFNYLHLQVLLRTILAAVFVTLFDFAMCYPLAFFMAQVAKGGNKRLLFLCLLLPFWVNEILRAFAFTLIFAEQGLINTVMLGIGIWSAPMEFIQTDIALYTGLTYAYILLMIFPLYNAIESLDHNQIEAARDLGSPWWRIHYRVVMPHAKPGIASGCTMVFMLTAGALAAPNILGGPSSLWFTQVIYQWFNTGGNWPQGSAYAFVLLIICIIFVQLVMKVFKVSLGDIAKR